VSALAEASIDTLVRWADRPADFVRELFEVEPDAWQLDVLDAFPHRQRLAMKACKGPGKTAVLAWLIWNFLVTWPHPKVAATAITKDNLDDNLWTELAKCRSARRCSRPPSPGPRRGSS
jgi:phage terminase large subunit